MEDAWAPLIVVSFAPADLFLHRPSVGCSGVHGLNEWLDIRHFKVIW